MATPANQSFHTYDPNQFSLIVGGKIIHGFADGSFIEIERDEDMFSKKVGVDGEVTRSKSNNRAGKVRITLMQSSSSNDDLSAFALADELTNAGAVPVLAKDGSGRSAFATLYAWVKRFPKAGFAKEVQTWTWELDTAALDIVMGGN